MKFFKEIYKKFNLLYDYCTDILDIVVGINQSLNELRKKQKEEAPAILTVARHTLGSIDLKDITDPDGIDEADYTEYMARAVQFYDFFEKEAKWMMKLQHDYWFTSSENWEQTMFGRGTTNGIQLMLDRFSKLSNEYTARTTKEKEPPIGSHDDILKKLQVEGSDDLATELGVNK